MIRHAGLVARRVGGRWAGALIEGPPGVGKSDLALRALAQGFRLVADDQVLVWASGGRLYGRAPGPLAGLIEVRGQGVLPESQLDFAEIILFAQCVSGGEDVERLPEPQAETIAGIPLPRLTLRPLEPSAPARLGRAIEHLGAAAQQAYLPASLGGRDRAGTGDIP